MTDRQDALAHCSETKETPMNSLIRRPLPGTVPDPRYPDSDGRFMGDTDFHNHAMRDICEGLEDRFADRPNVYVASNLIMYYDEDDPRKRKDPDVLVAKNVGKHKRRSFRVWEEKTFPSVLFEVASRKTWRNDIGEKRELYAQLRIKEYFVFDPEGRYLDPPLQGFRSVNGKSVPITPNPDGSLLSKELGLYLVPEDSSLRFLDAKTGAPIPTRLERADQEKERAEQERLRAEEEALRAQREKERNAQLVAELERLRAELAKHKKEKG
jgi:Uma2 family endonuclease